MVYALHRVRASQITGPALNPKLLTHSARMAVAAQVAVQAQQDCTALIRQASQKYGVARLIQVATGDKRKQGGCSEEPDSKQQKSACAGNVPESVLNKMASVRYDSTILHACHLLPQSVLCQHFLQSVLIKR